MLDQLGEDQAHRAGTMYQNSISGLEIEAVERMDSATHRLSERSSAEGY
jgi:hypothetical protein